MSFSRARWPSRIFAREVAGGERGQSARLQQGMSELWNVIVFESAEGIYEGSLALGHEHVQ